MSVFTESTVEDAALEIFENPYYTILHGPTIAPGETVAGRASYGDVVLLKRLREAFARINPQFLPTPSKTRHAGRCVQRARASSKITGASMGFRQMACPSNTGEKTCLGRQAEPCAIRRVSSLLARPENNDWAAVNQFTIEENRRYRRPDVIVFVNGLPLAVIARFWQRLSLAVAQACPPWRVFLPVRCLKPLESPYPARPRGRRGFQFRQTESPPRFLVARLLEGRTLVAAVAAAQPYMPYQRGLGSAGRTASRPALARRALYTALFD